MWTVPYAELCNEAASLGLFAEVSTAQQEMRKRRAEAERRVHQCAAPADLHAALAAAVELGAPSRTTLLSVVFSELEVLRPCAATLPGLELTSARCQGLNTMRSVASAVDACANMQNTPTGSSEQLVCAARDALAERQAAAAEQLADAAAYGTLLDFAQAKCAWCSDSDVRHLCSMVTPNGHLAEVKTISPASWRDDRAQ